MAEWNVYYDSFFYADMQTPQDKRAGAEIPINKGFLWSTEEWKILSMYIFDEGPVFHICKRIKDETIREFYEKWGHVMQMAKEGRHEEVSQEQRTRMRFDSPYTETPSIDIEIDGKAVDSGISMSNAWIPRCYDNPEPCKNMPHILNHYTLSESDGWLITHVQGRWYADFSDIKNIDKIEITLKADPIDIPGPHFTIKENGEEISFIRPLTGQEHTLKVLSSEPGLIEGERMPDNQWEPPNHYMQMTYTLTPDLTEDIFSIRDCSSGMSGAGLMFEYGDEQDDPVHTAFSSLYFDPIETVQWFLNFHEKPQEDFSLTLKAGRDFNIT